MENADKKTLRLVMPQWQGGNLPAYYFGAQMLEWLAPPSDGPAETVAVEYPTATPLPVEAGIVARNQLLKQARAARAAIDKHAPNKIVILGGDCLVDLAPFAYLNELYEGNLGVLWVDSHPDVMTPQHFKHAHAMVLGNLLGQGDPDFIELVKLPVDPRNVMYAGMDEMSDVEQDIVGRLGLKSAKPADLAVSSRPVLDWLKETGIRHLAIHLDLDVLDPSQFRALLFANPQDAPGAWESVPQGKMSLSAVARLLNEVAAEVDVVAIGITEHLPWDAIALKAMLEKLPLIGR